MVTRRDLRFVTSEDQGVTEIMTPRENLVTSSPDTQLEEARSILHEHKIEKLPLIDEEGKMAGLMTGKDIEKRIKFQNAVHDDSGQLIVAAAIGVGDGYMERSEALVNAGVDCLVIDAATGHTSRVIEVTERLSGYFEDLPVVSGNVATKEGADDLIDAGAAAVKTGVGPGSICTTRVVSGVGVPQFTAIKETAAVCRERGVPMIADGGIRYSGDIVKALAGGADTVMTGSLLAGTEESPGRTVNHKGRTFKEYRGMGSERAMQDGSKDRYGQNASEKVTPEGVESRVPYQGPISDKIFHLMGGVRSGMGYVGAETLDQLRGNAEFLRITSGGLRESHAHDVELTEEPVNYSPPS
jgi:IMP dehydrogenase